MSVRILLVKDDSHICDTVRVLLAGAEYQTDACMDGNEACAEFYENTYQLVVLGITLPGMNEYGLLCEPRAKNDTPILMMTALPDDENRIRTLDTEADDYVTKPFKMQVLLGRVETLLRRSNMLAKEIRIDRLTLLPEDFAIFCDGIELPLTRRKFETPSLLVQNRGGTLTHGIVLLHMWGYGFEGDGNTVHAYVKNLRVKLPENIIKTIRSVGYRLEESQ